jgi:hypothetical protein
VDYLDFPLTNATIGYLIARPKSQASNAPKRVCLVYTSLNDTYFWTVDPTNCPRKIRPGVAGIFKFNTTLIGIIIMYNNNWTNLLIICLLLFSETCGATTIMSTCSFYQTLAFTWLSIGIVVYSLNDPI